MRGTLLRFVGTTLTAFILLTALGRAQTTSKAPAPLDGNWNGKVTAQIGEMNITATFVTKNGIVSGAVKNFHGEFTITEGKVVDGTWVLPFTTDDGSKGKLSGTIKDGVFAGEWDFRPMAFGTFTLERAK